MSDLILNGQRIYPLKDILLFDEKLVFEKNEFRTPKIKTVVSLICNVGEDLEGTKNGKVTIFSKPSHQVNLTDQNPNLIYKDLDILVSLKRALT